MQPTSPGLTTSQEQQLNAMIAAHKRVRARLSAPDQVMLAQLAAVVRKQIVASPPSAPFLLLYSATLIVQRAIPSLSVLEAKSLAEYTLGAIASPSSGGVSSNELMYATQQMQETQMSFNLQYLQLQNQLQNENRQYSAVSNIVKTKHDTVKNSISNIR
jgi:hypothetical protein